MTAINSSRAGRPVKAGRREGTVPVQPASPAVGARPSAGWYRVSYARTLHVDYRVIEWPEVLQGVGDTRVRDQRLPEILLRALRHPEALRPETGREWAVLGFELQQQAWIALVVSGWMDDLVAPPQPGEEDLSRDASRRPIQVVGGWMLPRQQLEEAIDSTAGVPWPPLDLAHPLQAHGEALRRQWHARTAHGAALGSPVGVLPWQGSAQARPDVDECLSQARALGRVDFVLRFGDGRAATLETVTAEAVSGRTQLLVAPRREQLPEAEPADDGAASASDNATAPRQARYGAWLPAGAALAGGVLIWLAKEGLRGAGWIPLLAVGGVVATCAVGVPVLMRHLQHNESRIRSAPSGAERKPARSGVRPADLTRSDGPRNVAVELRAEPNRHPVSMNGAGENSPAPGSQATARSGAPLDL